MKLFIDDSRDAPSGFTLARNYLQATILLDCMTFDFISVDYDLHEEKTGVDVIEYMASLDPSRWPKHINVHSTHVSGYKEVAKKARECFGEALIITTNHV